MITAKEAKELLKSLTKISTESILKSCDEEIKKAVQKGCDEITIDLEDYPSNIIQPLKVYLSKLGYTTDYFTGSQWDPCCKLTISWKDENV